MNVVSYEQVAREIRRDREAEAAGWALVDQLPRQSTNAATDHGLVAAVIALVSAVMVFHRGA